VSAPRSDAPSRVLLLGALLTGALVLAGPALWLDTTGLVAGLYAHDDCFYYFQIARNLAGGHGFTFDGRHATNGFHPLWLFALTPIFGLVPGDDAPLRAAALLEAALVLGAGVLIFRTLRPRLGGWPALLAALLPIAQPGSLRVFRSGMESSLLLFLLVAIWAARQAWRSSDAPALGRAFTLGGLAALCLACRLEAGLAVAALAWLDARRWRRAPAEALAIALPAAIVGGALLAWYRAAFGLPLPVSGLVKAHWAAQGRGDLIWVSLVRIPWFGERAFQRFFGPYFLYESPAAAVAYGALMATLLVVAVKQRARLAAAVRRGGLGFPLLTAGLMLLVDKIVLRHMEPWHQAPIVLATSLLGGALLAEWPRVARALAWLALAAVALRLPLSLLSDRSVATPRYVLDAAGWLRQKTPPDARVASWNGGGMLGYFSHRSVAVLDGFVNDGAYLRDVIRGGALEDYLARERIEWIGEPGCGPSPDLGPLVARNVRDRPGMPVPADAQARVIAAYELAAAFYRTGSPDGCPGFALWRSAGAGP
jgi:hypothetical protein